MGVGSTLLLCLLQYLNYYVKVIIFPVTTVISIAALQPADRFGVLMFLQVEREDTKSNTFRVIKIRGLKRVLSN